MSFVSSSIVIIKYDANSRHKTTKNIPIPCSKIPTSLSL
jgi:hypothetical protein